MRSQCLREAIGASADAEDVQTVGSGKATFVHTVENDT
jgi:hypothetical protein